MLTNASRDGSLVAYRTGPVDELTGVTVASAGLIDLESGTVRRLRTWTEKEASEVRGLVTYGHPLVSPNGRHLLLRRGARVLVLDTSGGSVVRTYPTRDVYNIAHGWLDDGRLWLVDRDRRILLARPGRPSRATGLTLDNPKGKDELLRMVAVSPDGRSILYAKDCNTRLWNRKGKDRVVSRQLVVTLQAWSPNGRLFVLQTGEYMPHRDCGRESWASGDHDYVFERSGDRVSGSVLSRVSSLSHGHWFAWSRDSRLLFVWVQPTGTEVGGYQYLEAAAIRRRARTRLLPDRLVPDAVPLPGGRLLFGRFDVAPVSTNDYRSTGTIYVADVARVNAPPSECAGKHPVEADADGDGRVDFVFHEWLGPPNAKGGAVLGVCTADGRFDRRPGAGQAEVLEIADVEGDGRDEIFYGGTSASARIMSIAVFRGGALERVRARGGEVLLLLDGLGEGPSAGAVGCEDRAGDKATELVQVRVRPLARRYRWTRRSYDIKGRTAVVVRRDSGFLPNEHGEDIGKLLAIPGRLTQACDFV